MSLPFLRLRPPMRLLALSIVGFLCMYFVYHSVYNVNKAALDNAQEASSNQPWQYTAPTTLRQPNPNLNAAMVTFVRGDRGTLQKLRSTIRNIEDSFNEHHGYPYIIFTDEDLSTEFKELVSSTTKGDVSFEKVGKDYYGYPKGIDMKKAAQARIDLKDVMFGDSEDYRFNSRFLAGTIFR
jgi:alpha 1,2-mannosyltransferase